MKDRLTTRMPEQLIERINMEAEKVQMSTSKLVRKLIEDALNQGSIGGPMGTDLGPRLTQIDQKISDLLSQDRLPNGAGTNAVDELQMVFRAELRALAIQTAGEVRKARNAATDACSHACAASSAADISAKESKRTQALYSRLTWAAYLGLGLILMLIIILQYRSCNSKSEPAASPPAVVSPESPDAISGQGWAEVFKEIASEACVFRSQRPNPGEKSEGAKKEKDAADDLHLLSQIPRSGRLLLRARRLLHQRPRTIPLVG